MSAGFKSEEKDEIITNNSDNDVLPKSIPVDSSTELEIIDTEETVKAHPDPGEMAATPGCSFSACGRPTSCQEVTAWRR